MKRIFITGFYLLIACVGVIAAPIEKDLNKDSEMILNLEMGFSDSAKEEGAFVSWDHCCNRNTGRHLKN